MKMYQVIARNENGLVIQKSDPHTWAECETLFEEFHEYDRVAEVDITFVGIK